MDLLKVELTKLLKKRSTKVFLIIYGIVLIGMSLMYLIAENSLALSFFSGNQFIGASLSVMMGFLLPLFALYLSSSSISLDTSRGTMKNMYLLPISRTKIYLSKLAAVQLIIGGFLIIQFVLSGMIAIIVDGFTFIGIGSLFMDYLGSFIVLGLINIAGNILTLLFKNTGLTVIVAYLSYIGMTILDIYLPRLTSINIASILSEYSQLFSFNNGGILLSTVAYYIIFILCGMLLFEKKEESLCQYD